MSKKHKPEPPLHPELVAWAAKRCGTEEWGRVVNMIDRKMHTALLAYLTGIVPQAMLAEFEASLPPEVLAERRAIEAAKAQAVEDERRTIRNGDSKPITQTEILSPARWKPLGATEREAAEEAARATAEGEQIREFPEAVF